MHEMWSDSLDRATLEYVQDEIDKLIVRNFENNYRKKTDALDLYSRGKDYAFKEVSRVIANILNK